MRAALLAGLLLAAAAAVALAAPRAPELAGTDPVTGKRVTLAGYRGKPVMIVSWASW